MKIFTLFLLVLILCKLTYSQENTEYKYVKKYFTKDQIIVLESIISFVDSAVNPEKVDIESAYKAYINSLDVDEYIQVRLFDQDIKEKFLTNLPEDVFDKIWTKQIPRSVKTRDTTLYYPENFWSFDINIIGDYMKLLKVLGKKDKYYKDISKSIWLCGGIGPTVFVGIFRQFNEFNLDKFTDKLWLAIFLLTIEESTEIRVEKYLSKSVRP